MTKCSALSCKNKGVHGFPKDRKRRKAWENALRIKNFKAKDSSRLCSSHFTLNDYYGQSIYTKIKQSIFVAYSYRQGKDTATAMAHVYTKIRGVGIKVSGEQKKYSKPEFTPPYFEQISPITKKNAINAIIEIRALWNYVILDAFHNYSHMYYQLLQYPITSELKATCRKDKESFAMYDIRTEEWLIEPSEPPYKFCYNGEDFIDFTIAKNTTNCYRFLLVGKYTKMMQEPNLVTQTAAALNCLHAFVMPSTKLTVGVPGCGKTRHIIKNHSPGSLVLTSCKEGAEDIRKRMAENNGVPQLIQ